MHEDIHDIAEDGVIEQMQELLNEGIDINTLDESFGITPLHSAFDNDQDEMVFFLLEKGANPAVQDKEGYTALHYAVKDNNVEVAEAILKKYPHVVNIESDIWGSPLLQALSESIDMVKLLISYGANKQAGGILHAVKAYNDDEMIEIFSEELKDFVE